ncbi:MAG: hypothetical protein WBV73_20890 [Phormidium sp.]
MGSGLSLVRAGFVVSFSAVTAKRSTKPAPTTQDPRLAENSVFVPIRKIDTLVGCTKKCLLNAAFGPYPIQIDKIFVMFSYKS